MKRFFTLLLLFVFTYSFTFAQVEEPVAEAPVESAYLPKVNALLWQISGQGLELPSYLFGTIHMIGKEDFFFSDEAKEAVKNSELVTFEINMEDMTNMGAQMALLSKAFMADNLSLADLLSEEDYNLVKNHFEKEVGIPIFLFERVKPMFLTVLTDMDMSDMQGGLGGGGDIVSYEMEIMELAKADGKKMGGLETAEFQMSMFDSIPYKAQAEMLVTAIKSGDDGDKQFDEMVKMYKDQDIQAMVSMINDDEAGIGGYEDLLLVMRNKNWIPIMAEMMAAQRTFFAVGAGHLGGENGVIALLRKAGYTLTPMP